MFARPFPEHVSVASSPRNIVVSDPDKSSNPSSTRSVVHRSLVGGGGRLAYTNPLALTKGLKLGDGHRIESRF